MHSNSLQHVGIHITYIDVYTCVIVHMRTCVCMYACTFACVHVCVLTHTHTHGHMHMYMHVCKCVCMCVCLCVCVRVCVCVCVFACMYVHWDLPDYVSSCKHKCVYVQYSTLLETHIAIYETSTRNVIEFT